MSAAAGAADTAAADERMDTDERVRSNSRDGVDGDDNNEEGEGEGEADGEGEGEGEEQQRLALEEYAIWKKNTPFLCQ